MTKVKTKAQKLNVQNQKARLKEKSDDQDFFLYNSFQDEQEAIKVVFGSTKNDYEQNHWYSHG